MLWPVPLLLQLSTVQTGSPPATTGPDIVVVGRRLADTAATLAACLERHCPPDEDSAKSLDHATNQFIAGNYPAARRTLRQALGRIGSQARAYPMAVADLWHASGQVAAHLGEAEDQRFAALEALDILRRAFGADDPRTLVQQIDAADTLTDVNERDYAASLLRAALAGARRRGQVEIEGVAMLRLARLFYRAGGDNTDSKRILAEIFSRSEPAMAPTRRGADILAARIAADRGDRQAIDRLVATYRASATKSPVLVWAPPFKSYEAPVRYNQTANPDNNVLSEAVDQWVDLTFRIEPDGTVHDVEALRSSEPGHVAWIDDVKAAIALRRYAPLDPKAGSPGLQRVERYTRTARWQVTTGTRIRSRQAQPRIEVVDLTASQQAKAAK